MQIKNEVGDLIIWCKSKIVLKMYRKNINQNVENFLFESKSTHNKILADISQMSWQEELLVDLWTSS